MRKNYRSIKIEFEKKIHNNPGVVTVGLGKERDHIVIVVFVEDRLKFENNIPKEYKDIPVVIRPAKIAVAHSGVEI